MEWISVNQNIYGCINCTMLDQIRRSITAVRTFTVKRTIYLQCKFIKSKK